MEQKDYPDKLYVEKDYQHKNFFYGYPHGDRSSVEYVRADLVPKWHKYPDEKPPVKGIYIVTQYEQYPYNIFEGYWDDKSDCFFRGPDSFVTLDNIIAWMELPKTL